jgi:hypothetical protein
MWSSGNDILVRLAIPGVDDQKGDIERVTLLLQRGVVNGASVTLMKGDPITIAGYMVEAPYMESGRLFAERARKTELLADVPGLSGVVLERMATYVIVERLDSEEVSNLNEVILEGVVAKVWERGSQLYARLAVYDQHTQAEEMGRGGKNGRPWRKAHYVSIHLPEGQVDGRKIHLAKKDRLRVHGRLSERRYSESLALFLLRAGQIGLLASVSNADDVREVRTPRVATYVVVQSLIQFTK